MNNVSNDLTPEPSKQSNKSLGLLYLLLGIGVLGLLSYGLYGLFADPPPDVSKEAFPSVVKGASTADQNEAAKLKTGQLPLEIEESPETEDEDLDIDKATVLPALDHSDRLVRRSIRDLSTSPALSGWTNADHLIRRFVTLVDNIARGKIPRKQMAFFAPKGQFQVMESKGTLIIDPKSYQRYDVYADFLSSLDSAQAADLYRRLEPIINLAYQDLGNPQSRFDTALFQAIGHLQKTPVVEGDIALIRPSVMYKFNAKELEVLSPAQKQLLRTGPRNTRIIQRKLSSIAGAIRSNSADSKVP